MGTSFAVRPTEPPLTIVAIAVAAFRLVLPTVGLLAVYALAYQGLATPITTFDTFPDEKWFLNPGHWLTAGHVLLPLAWFVSSLTNRRYGSAYALGSLALAWVIIGLLAALLMSSLDGVFPVSPLPPRRVSLAFLFALFLGQIIAIYVFDRTRGRTWWGAPLFAALWGQTAFIVSFYPLVHLGLEEPWPNFMFMDLALKIVAGLALLLPYYVLRPVVRPLPGFGGA